MDGAIFFATKYGSTETYARWIGEATGLPVYDIRDGGSNPEAFDFVVFGTPVIYHKLMGRSWVQRHLDTLLAKPTILFSVSGAPAGAKLDGWIINSLPEPLIRHMHHVALQGRQDPKDLTWFDRMMLIVGGMFNPDRKAGREELQGFDFMDRNSIQPIVDMIEKCKSNNISTEQQA